MGRNDGSEIRPTSAAPPDLTPIREPADFPALGSVVREYLPRPWWIGLAGSGALFVLFLPLAVIALSLDSKWLIAPTMIVDAFAVAGVVICGLLVAVSYQRRVELRERGFVYYTPLGNSACAWELVKNVYVVVHNFPPSTELRFDLSGDEEVTLSWLINGQDDLLTHVQKATTPLIRARIDRTLAIGEEVSFGPYLSVDPQGMRLLPNGPGGQELRMRWREVSGVVLGRVQANPGAQGLAGAVLQMQLQISGAEGQPVWPIASGNVANFEIFLDLLRRYTGFVPRTG